MLLFRIPMEQLAKNAPRSVTNDFLVSQGKDTHRGMACIWMWSQPLKHKLFEIEHIEQITLPFIVLYRVITTVLYLNQYTSSSRGEPGAEVSEEKRTRELSIIGTACLDQTHLQNLACTRLGPLWRQTKCCPCPLTKEEGLLSRGWRFATTSPWKETWKHFDPGSWVDQCEACWLSSSHKHSGGMLSFSIHDSTLIYNRCPTNSKFKERKQRYLIHVYTYLYIYLHIKYVYFFKCRCRLLSRTVF